MDSGRYSEALASTRILKHSPESSRGQCGENLAWASYDQTGRLLSRPPSPPPELGPGPPVFRPQHPPPCSLGATGPERERGPRTLCVCSRGLPAAHHSVSEGWLRARPALGARDTQMSQTARPSPSEELPAEEWGRGRQIISVPFPCRVSA